MEQDEVSCSLAAGRQADDEDTSDVFVTPEQAPRQQNGPVGQPLKVYLRVRPFSKAEIANNESQDCVNIETSELVALHAPKQSSTMKNCEKGIGQAVHKFTFTKIFGPDTTQADFFDGTVKDLVDSFTDGKNGLVFTYGVTNAGKTFTIQGTPKDGGILPRSLDVVFNRIRGKHYMKMDFKPFLSNDVMKLVDTQVKQEEAMKASILATLKEDSGRVLRSANQSSPQFNKSSSSPMSLTSESGSAENSFTTNDGLISMHQFSVWVSFCEIYNEYVYDLLDVFPTTRQQKRPVLKVCDDQAGSSYLKDLKWFNVTSTEEACKILKIGNKNRSLASTRMNQQSSRSHSIFSIRLIRLSDEDMPGVLGVSEMSLCDLAGSERCTKTEAFGDRLKEAGNINNSLLILGKCIGALKQNQNVKMKHNYIPFRESKLTRLFQPFFCGKGLACLIVNINQCASNYDETLHVMKFSAVAKEVVQTINPRVLEFLSPRLVGKNGKPIHMDANTSIEDLLLEEDFLEDEDEMDLTVLSQEELFSKIANLREKLVTERQSKFVLEMQIRKEMGEEMLQQLLDLEATWSKRCEGLKETYEEQFEERFDMYKKAIQKHAYNSAMEEIEETHVPVEELEAEQEKVKDRDNRILELEMALNLHRPPGAESIFNIAGNTTDLQNKEMSIVLDQIKKQRDMKEELVNALQIEFKAFEKEADQAIEKLKEENMSIKEENQSIKALLEQKDQEMEALLNARKRVLELETTVLGLEDELNESTRHSSADSQQPRPKRVFFSALKAAVAGSPKPSCDKSKANALDETRGNSRKRTMSHKQKE